MGKNTCGKGVVANQLQSCPDISAVGIQSITQSANDLYLYITLTNGQTTTYTLPVAPPLPILYGTGAPANSLGAVGQTYIDTASGNVYLKGATTWTLELNIIGPQGPSGASILYNDVTNTNNGNVINTLTPLKSYTLGANTLSSDGSKLVIRSYIENQDVNDLGVQILIAGVILVDNVTPPVLPSTGSVTDVAYEVSVTRTSSGAGVVGFSYRTMNGNNVVHQYQTIPNSPFAINWANANAITVEAITPTVNAALCRQLEVDLFIL